MLQYMLDTDTVIYTIKNRPPDVRATFRSHAGQLAVSSITLMELIYGAEISSSTETNLRAVESFSARLDVLPFDQAAATHAGQVRAELRRLGSPIGAYDEMIAGHARSLGLVVVTNNLRHFRKVPGIRVVNWIKGQRKTGADL